MDLLHAQIDNGSGKQPLTLVFVETKKEPIHLCGNSFHATTIHGDITQSVKKKIRVKGNVSLLSHFLPHINKSLMTLGTDIKKLSEGAESQGVMFAIETANSHVFCNLHLVGMQIHPSSVTLPWHRFTLMRLKAALSLIPMSKQ
ncbi:unnamed protein product [Lactuca saligna]|uniref:Uncharacterized protein n=1 Tax=Lactuca saligna TaxID=75948 RepID=A0AA35V7B4_LACSI|nr:unnamed protein product [Lactuca saligna]